MALDLNSLGGHEFEDLIERLLSTYRDLIGAKPPYEFQHFHEVLIDLFRTYLTDFTACSKQLEEVLVNGGDLKFKLSITRSEELRNNLDEANSRVNAKFALEFKRIR